MQEAALIEPFACVVRALTERTTILPQERIYVAGPGVIGQMAVKIAKQRGARVIAGGRNSRRLQMAQDHGADGVINLNNDDVDRQAELLTDGALFDKVVECSGAERSLRDCVRLLRKGGELIQIGLFGKPVTIPFDALLLKECRITTTYAAEPSSWIKALEMIRENGIRLNAVIGDVFPFHEWQAAFDHAEQKGGSRYLLSFRN